jgi:hypothetical protein
MQRLQVLEPHLDCEALVGVSPSSMHLIGGLS